MSPIISISNLSKTYKGGFQALKKIDLTINKGEIFALLGPNGAGKTTLISIICGIVNSTTGAISVNDFDTIKNYRQTRSLIGLVPQELTTEAFETVFNSVSHSRGLFGKRANPTYIEDVLKRLSLWEKRDSKIVTLSGGMKRRLLIAKALAHEPQILFLDEPTAGVDVELRKDMWDLVRGLKEKGVTIILTTHYIEEAEEMADRVGVIHKGEIILVEDKKVLMKKLGHKQLTLEMLDEVSKIPPEVSHYHLEFGSNKNQLIYTYDSNKEDNGIPQLLKLLGDQGLQVKDLHTNQSSLEDIFVQLVRSV